MLQRMVTGIGETQKFFARILILEAIENYET